MIAPIYRYPHGTVRVSKQRVLVVDDEIAIVKVVKYALEVEGYEVRIAGDIASATREVDAYHPDIVVLDVMLPGGNGLELTRQLRETSDVPIIILSARDGDADRVLGLQYGADDYVCKPFSPRELVGRVQAILRRSGVSPDERSCIRTGDLEVDTAAREVYRDGKKITLTGSEYQVVLTLARHPGKVFSRKTILASLGDGAPISDEAGVDVLIGGIREKLEPNPKRPVYLVASRDLGYRLGDPQE